MNAVSVSLNTLASVATAGEALAVALEALGANAQSVDQFNLPLNGEDMACEAFMIERDELQDEIARLQAEVGGLRTQLSQELKGESVYREGLRSEIERLHGEISTANEVFKNITSFASELQHSLNQVGISYVADEATGLPLIRIDTVRLAAGIQGIANGAAPLDL
ncbi:hypothetical protein [Novosphingobium panipatense]|uniref:Uncharacterized protein n=1 Tax=Novosphingobium panipatense TaxID=428991 RepID=A0ABY1Q3V1_9SPHN|nr:hypothetical protein [Novosphingobium panipatense]SMP58541.1 hypothetical protein SAMN06296065_102493 [Novosphingobium panipatense]